MAHWVRFDRAGVTAFGTLDGSTIAVHRGDMFAGSTPTGETVAVSAVRLLAPCQPSKLIALWNNFHGLAAKLGQAIPPEPLFFIKAASCYAGPGDTLHRPAGYEGKVVYEGELGIVIGANCRNASAADAEAAIFGYTCINDLTASDILNKDPTFAQWTRAKSFDGFGPMGPAIATGLDPGTLVVRTVLNGAERQNYPVSDMIFGPVAIVQHLSHSLTLVPGDVICCGTSLGVGAMREPSNEVAVTIEGIGTLRNTYVQ